MVWVPSPISIWAPANPVEPMLVNAAAGITTPSSLKDPTAAWGATTLTKFNRPGVQPH
jgi:hypothetical protein